MASFYDILYRRPGQKRVSDQMASGDKPKVSDIDHGAAGMEQGSASRGSTPLITSLFDSPRSGRTSPPPVRWTQRWKSQIELITQNLLNQLDLKGHFCLTFVGLGPRVGVTTLSYLLAEHLASQVEGKRTLYVEMDTRPGRSPSPASSALIRMGDTLTDVIWRAPTNLSVLTIRPGLPLKTQERTAWLQELIQRARQEFDHIILDVPPFQHSPDTLIVARETDKRVLVLKSGTRHSDVNDLVTKLANERIPLEGAVLTFREYPSPRWLTVHD